MRLLTNFCQLKEFLSLWKWDIIFFCSKTQKRIETVSFSLWKHKSIWFYMYNSSCLHIYDHKTDTNGCFSPIFHSYWYVFFIILWHHAFRSREMMEFQLELSFHFSFSVFFLVWYWTHCAAIPLSFRAILVHFFCQLRFIDFDNFYLTFR